MTNNLKFFAKIDSKIYFLVVYFWPFVYLKINFKNIFLNSIYYVFCPPYVSNTKIHSHLEKIIIKNIFKNLKSL